MRCLSCASRVAAVLAIALVGSAAALVSGPGDNATAGMPAAIETGVSHTQPVPLGTVIRNAGPRGWGG